MARFGIERTHICNGAPDGKKSCIRSVYRPGSDMIKLIIIYMYIQI